MSSFSVSDAPTLTIDGQVFFPVGNVIKLIGSTTNTGPHCTLRREDGSAAYTPSGAKNFRVLAAKFNQMGTVLTTPLIYQSDNDVGVSTNTAPTNPVYPGGSATLGSLRVVSATPGTIIARTLNFLILNGKYLTVDQQNATAGSLFGWEIWGVEE